MDETNVGSERQLNASTECVPVDSRNHRHRQLLPDPADLLCNVSNTAVIDISGVGLLFTIGWRCAGELLHRAHVEASAERLALARQDDAPNTGFSLQSFTRFGNGAEHLAIECIALVGTGETHVCDTVVYGDRDAI